MLVTKKLLLLLEPHFWPASFNNIPSTHFNSIIINSFQIDKDLRIFDTKDILHTKKQKWTMSILVIGAYLVVATMMGNDCLNAHPKWIHLINWFGCSDRLLALVPPRTAARLKWAQPFRYDTMTTTMEINLPRSPPFITIPVCRRKYWRQLALLDTFPLFLYGFCAVACEIHGDNLPLGAALSVFKQRHQRLRKSWYSISSACNVFWITIRVFLCSQWINTGISGQIIRKPTMLFIASCGFMIRSARFWTAYQGKLFIHLHLNDWLNECLLQRIGYHHFSSHYLCYVSFDCVCLPYVGGWQSNVHILCVQSVIPMSLFNCRIFSSHCCKSVGLFSTAFDCLQSSNHVTL